MSLPVSNTAIHPAPLDPDSSSKSSETGTKLPGVSGIENNTVLFSCPKIDAPACYQAARENAMFAEVTGKNLVGVAIQDGQAHDSEPRNQSFESSFVNRW